MPTTINYDFDETSDAIIKKLLPELNKFQNLIIGVSGGMDSMLLLQLMLQYKNTLPPLQVLHINHQLQKEADDWQHFVEIYCEQNQLPYQSIKVNIAQNHPKGTEAAARKARYNAFSQVIQVQDALILAHHLNDQAETLLMRIFRGSGITGLQGMQIQQYINVNHFSGWVFRPLLGIHRSTIECWIKEKNIPHIKDPSNQDLHYTRNYIRQKIIPSIIHKFPHALESINRLSKVAQLNQSLITEITHMDYLHTTGQPYPQKINVLNLEKLQTLSVARQSNLLRFFFTHISSSHLEFSHTTTLFKMINQAATLEGKSFLRFALKQYEFQIYPHHLCLKPLANKQNIKINNNTISQKIKIFRINYDCSSLELSKLQEVASQDIAWSISDIGLDPVWMKGQTFLLTKRNGGERFHPKNRSKSQTIKKLLQEYRIPNEQRSEIYLLGVLTQNEKVDLINITPQTIKHLEITWIWVQALGFAKNVPLITQGLIPSLPEKLEPSIFDN